MAFALVVIFAIGVIYLAQKMEADASEKSVKEVIRELAKRGMSQAKAKEVAGMWAVNIQNMLRDSKSASEIAEHIVLHVDFRKVFDPRDNSGLKGSDERSSAATKDQLWLEDFIQRLGHINDDVVASMLVRSVDEYYRMCAISPKIDVWFEEYSPDHEIHLEKLATALEVRVRSHQMSGAMMLAPPLMILMFTCKGITDPAMTADVVNLWDTLTVRGRRQINNIFSLMDESISEMSIAGAHTFRPTALYQKYSIVSGLDSRSPTTSASNGVMAANKPLSSDTEEILIILLDLLNMQASMMRSSVGEDYLKSDFSLGFVAGFTDAFLQKAQRKRNLSSDEQHGIMLAVLDGVFVDIDPKAIDRFCDLQESGDSEFMAGQMKGGQGAFDYLNNPMNPKAQMCWFADFMEKHATQDDMAVAATEVPEYQQNTDAEGYAVTLSKFIRYGLKRFDNDTNEVEIPRYIIEDLYFAGFVVGYLAIVIDGMESEQNKTKEDRGLFGMEFYRRLDKDIGTQLVKLLEDLDYARATAQSPTFQQGRNHGSLWAAHYFGLARQELHDQVLKDARVMSQKHGIDLVNCLFLLTFWDRYKK